MRYGTYHENEQSIKFDWIIISREKLTINYK